MDIIIGIDIGTSKLAISTIDPDKKIIVRTVEEDIPYLNNMETWKREQSPEEITNILKKLLKSCLKKGDKVIAIGITGQMHGILGLDSDGKPMTNFVTWQDERGNIKIDRNKTITQEIKEKLRDEKISGISSGFGLVTLYYWLKNGIKPYKISTITDYIGMVLTGNSTPYIDPTMAESLGCYDVKEKCWKESILENLGIPRNILPQLTESTKIIGKTEKNTFLEIFDYEIPVVVSIGDNQASFLGSVKHYTDSTLINIGTGSQISIAEENYKKAFSLPFIDGIDVQIRPFIENKYLIAGNAISGGTVYKTLYNFFETVGKDLFGIKNFDSLYNKMEETARKALTNREIDNLEVYPLFAGKRSSPDERGWIQGINLTNFKPSVLILQTLKGMIKILLEMFNETTLKSKNYLIGSGNGIRKNKLLQDLIKEMLNRKLNISKYNEEAVIGAAINAAVAVGIYKNFEDASELIIYED